MPQHTDLPNGLPATETQTKAPKLGFDLRGIAAAAARNALQVPQAVQSDQPADVAAPQADDEAERHEATWAPPGNVASAAATAAAMAAATGRIQATGVRVETNRAPNINDLEDIRRDQELAARLGRDRALALRNANQLPAAPLPGRIAEVPVENALAVMNQAVANPITVTPDWHEVQNLPGYRQGGILRRIIRKTFAEVTDAHLEQMHMICELLNPPAHVHAVANWIVANAEPADAADIDYGPSVPGFKAALRMFHDQKTTYVVTQDVGGHYIYICPRGAAPVHALDHKIRLPEPKPAAPGGGNTPLLGPGL